MAIVFIAGTTAELIKIAPVMVELDNRGIPYRLWSTAQHIDGVSRTLADLGIRPPDRYLVSGRNRTNIARSSQVPGWFLNIAGNVARNFSSLRKEVGDGIVLVHGDTFTTAIGALVGRLLGVKVGHIEAGLRSGSIKSPFPEELNRRLVGHLATVDFAPTDRELGNLEQLRRVRDGKAEVVVTGANTVVDALRAARGKDVDIPQLPERFGLVTLHRFELVQSKVEFASIVHKLKEFSRSLPLVFVVGHSERERLTALGLDDVFDSQMSRIDKRSYAEFLPILMRAQLVVTDSGGLQEECAALGIPCAVHRQRTERYQGIGENVVLTGLKIPVLEDFLAHWEDYRRPSQIDRYHPSRIIADWIGDPRNATH